MSFIILALVGALVSFLTVVLVLVLPGLAKPLQVRRELSGIVVDYPLPFYVPPPNR